MREGREGREGEKGGALTATPNTLAFTHSPPNTPVSAPTSRRADDCPLCSAPLRRLFFQSRLVSSSRWLLLPPTKVSPSVSPPRLALPHRYLPRDHAPLSTPSHGLELKGGGRGGERERQSTPLPPLPSHSSWLLPKTPLPLRLSPPLPLCLSSYPCFSLLLSPINEIFSPYPSLRFAVQSSFSQLPLLTFFPIHLQSLSSFPLSSPPLSNFKSPLSLPPLS